MGKSHCFHYYALIIKYLEAILYDFLVTVKAAPHEYVNRTGQPAENEAWF